MTTLQIIGLLAYIASLFFTVRHLDLKQLVEDKKLQHLVFGCAASVFILWMFRAGIYDGLNVHFLWLAALSLILGLRWAIVCSFISLLGVTIAGLENWAMFGINGVLGALIPLSVSYLIYNLSFHKLPRHFFVYVFICAFFPGAILIALKMALLGGYYFVDGFHDWNTVKDNFLILIPLMLFPEAMLNGMTMTLLIIYKPTWVYTFYDKFYLQDK
ncbi:energy-coupling factor ABC transporter permease [Aestuariibacter sp. AA17]|uniref:Energy-coupling factor ABC transporter permease n=1 Tax=Fluctibacter corallii TaxID=2984329 RepID=A0ABT3A9B8_9ALTE|nr:energy-coupling factor ABC transporter permease [Aestuariibacter sp. AA17]MCV2885200.1 energy-coupling factor ABC transporter permease [Aestuariibacter sp. AA17]